MGTQNQKSAAEQTPEEKLLTAIQQLQEAHSFSFDTDAHITQLIKSLQYDMEADA